MKCIPSAMREFIVEIVKSESSAFELSRVPSRSEIKRVLICGASLVLTIHRYIIAYIDRNIKRDGKVSVREFFVN